MSRCSKMQCVKCGSHNLRRRVNYPFGINSKGVTATRCGDCGSSETKFKEDGIRRKVRKGGLL